MPKTASVCAAMTAADVAECAISEAESLDAGGGGALAQDLASALQLIGALATMTAKLEAERRRDDLDSIVARLKALEDRLPSLAKSRDPHPTWHCGLCGECNIPAYSTECRSCRTPRSSAEAIPAAELDPDPDPEAGTIESVADFAVRIAAEFDRIAERNDSLADKLPCSGINPSTRRSRERAECYRDAARTVRREAGL